MNAGQTKGFPAELHSGSPPRKPTTLEFITSAPADNCEPAVTSSAVLNRVMRSRLPQRQHGYRLAKPLEKPSRFGVKSGVCWYKVWTKSSRWETHTHTHTHTYTHTPNMWGRKKVPPDCFHWSNFVYKTELKLIAHHIYNMIMCKLWS